MEPIFKNVFGITHQEIVSDPEDITILPTTHNEIQVGEFLLKCLEYFTIKEVDQDVLRKFTLKITLSKTDKEAKVLKTDPMYCLICKKNRYRDEAQSS